MWFFKRLFRGLSKFLLMLGLISILAVLPLSFMLPLQAIIWAFSLSASCSLLGAFGCATLSDDESYDVANQLAEVLENGRYARNHEDEHFNYYSFEKTKDEYHEKRLKEEAREYDKNHPATEENTNKLNWF